MKLKFTRKTWYFFLLAAAAVSMLGGFAVLGGMDFSGLELIVFCITGIKRQERAKNAPGTVCGCQAHACVLLHVNKKYGILGISESIVTSLQRIFCPMLRFEGLKYRKYSCASIPCLAPKSRAESNCRWKQSFPRNTVPDEQVTRYFLFPGFTLADRCKNVTLPARLWTIAAR